MAHTRHTVRRWPLWLACVTLVWCGTWPGVSLFVTEAAELLDGIAAVVNDEIITISEVREAMALEVDGLRQQYSGITLEQKLQELYRNTLQPLIDVQLQIERARKLNLRVSDEDIAYQMARLKEENRISNEELQQLLQSRGLTMESYEEQIRRSVLVSKVVNAEVRSRLVIMETELADAYRQQKERYRVAGELTVSHILFLVSDPTDTAQEERARQKVQDVLQQLRNGGNFETLAAQHSEGPSADHGGLLGPFRTGDLVPGFEEAVASLQPGEISDLVRTRVGWHIIRLEDKKDGSYKPFEDVREELRNELLRTKTEQKYAEWLQTLRQQAYITILYEG